MQKEKLYDYFILTARILLAWTFISYGYGKLNGEQFGLSAEQMGKPVKDLGLFKLSWFLFDQQPFKAFIGVSQILAGLLLLYNRTLLLGALLSLPILTNILIIDITYLKMEGFYWRLSYYLLLDFLILWHYRVEIFKAFRLISSGISTKFKYPFWAYLLLPLMAMILEIFGVFPKLITGLIFNSTKTLNELAKTSDWISEMISRIFK